MIYIPAGAQVESMTYQQTARKRIMSTLRGESTAHVPFTTYSVFSELSTFERNMREMGLGYVHIARSYDIVYKQASVREIYYTNSDSLYFSSKSPSIIRTEFDTPYGTLWMEQLPQPELFSRWTKHHIFKGPEDYKALLWLINDRMALPKYDNAAKLIENLGEDFVVRDQLPLEPMQNMITSTIMDAQTFSFEWYDNRDEIIKLYNAYREFNRSVYPIVANGPLEFANYGGNVIPSIIGRQNFNEYYVPNYEEAAEILHRKGKLIGSHFDDNNTTIMDEIGATSLDYIEAYDPCISPSIYIAFEKFKNKAIWINWPSAWHNEELQKAKQLTIELLKEHKLGQRLLIGVTENMPIGRDRILLPLISKAIYDAGK